MDLPASPRSAAPPPPRSPSSARPAKRDESRGTIDQARAAAELVPADVADFRRELTACLALCAPSAMGEQDRNEWLRAAWGTLRHLPADLLARGCAAARAEADHPSRIVPIVSRETGEWLRLRRRRWRDAQEESVPTLPEPRPTYCTAEEAAAILAEFGLRRAAAPLPPEDR